MPPVRAVVFDLGGVLADFGGVEEMRRLTGIDNDEEVWRRWLGCEWVRTFERGSCSAEDFSRGVVDDWGLPIEPAAFLDSFRGWIAAPFPGAEDLVRRVSGAAPVGCLSNTNAVHWEATASGWRLFELFDFRVLSFEVGLVKPDPEVFDHLCRTAGAAPEELVFLDDNQINVDAARAAGLRAFRAQGVDEARSVLEGQAVI